MKWQNISSGLANISVTDLSGVKVIYPMISDFIEKNHQPSSNGEWIEYDGDKLYADTSDYVAKEIEMHGDYEASVSKSIESHLDKGDLAIDIGAHIGHHMVKMRQCVGTTGMVWAFEPNPINADYIEATIQKNEWNNVNIFPIALSNTESSDQLIVFDSSNTGGAALADANDNSSTPADEFTVDTRKLTSILNEKSIDNIDLLKIDVEGAETNIINDLDGYLDNIETIILEFHTQAVDRDDAKEAFNALNNTGEISDLNGDSINLDHVLAGKVSVIWRSN